VTAKGTATFTIQASGATTSTLATPAVKINIPVSTKAKTVKVPFTMPTIAAGTYNVILTLTFANDTNAADKSVTSTGTFTV